MALSREASAPPVRPAAAALSTWLVTDILSRSPAALRASRLSAFAYTQLPEHHALKAELRPDYLASLARHQEIKAELVPLVAAWRAAGIEVLLYKGFYLAEFIYAAPGARFHGDVDLLVRPEQAAAALRLAGELGWGVAFDAEAARRAWASEAFVV
ncbi:MAG TPA: nucleotidyltransferase family protein, partial [Gemmatimonadales bacterium]|nr:nucleotidyltransferase family protein [Gemmatimonadales bacterium]